MLEMTPAVTPRIQGVSHSRPAVEFAPAIIRPVARRYMRRLLIGDLIILAVAIVASHAVTWLVKADWPTRSDLYVGITLIVVWPVILWIAQARTIDALGHGPEEFRRIVVSTTWTLGLIGTGAYLLGVTGSSWLLVGALLGGTAALLVFRATMRLRLDRHWMDEPLQRIFIVAPPAQARNLAFTLASVSRSFGVAGHRMLRETAPDPDNVVAEALDSGADTIVFSPSEATGHSWTQQLGWALSDSGLNLLVAPSLMDVAGPRLGVVPVQGLPLLRVAIPQFSRGASIFRRAQDILSSTLLLLILGLPMLVVALLIRIDSSGPALFRQLRVGRGGETFEVLKFRTMKVGADAVRDELRDNLESDSSDVLFKLRRDPRITRMGRFLRRFSIDEAPQLINVFRGQMSLVGPRPHSLDDVERYDEHADRRWLTKPGMTGLWQVSGRSDLDWETSVRLDLYYVDNWTPAMDLVILLRTFSAVLWGRGAY